MVAAFNTISKAPAIPGVFYLEEKDNYLSFLNHPNEQNNNWHAGFNFYCYSL